MMITSNADGLERNRRLRPSRTTSLKAFPTLDCRIWRTLELWWRNMMEDRDRKFKGTRLICRAEAFELSAASHCTPPPSYAIFRHFPIRKSGRWLYYNWLSTRGMYVRLQRKFAKHKIVGRSDYGVVALFFSFLKFCMKVTEFWVLSNEVEVMTVNVIDFYAFLFWQSRKARLGWLCKEKKSKNRISTQ